MSWLCFLLLAAAAVHARPQWPSGEPDPSDLLPEERINLHHSLKHVHDAATKAVKDVHGYIHQKLSSVAKKQLNIISRPLVKVMAPVFYLKDRLDSLRGTRKPTEEEEISAWCPTCIESENPSGKTSTTVSTTRTDSPCFEYDPNCSSQDLSGSETSTFKNKESSASPGTSSAIPEHQRSDDIPLEPTGSEIIFPDEWEKRTKSIGNDERESLNDFTVESSTNFDIRFGYGQSPILKNY